MDQLNSPVIPGEGLGDDVAMVRSHRSAASPMDAVGTILGESHLSKRRCLLISGHPLPLVPKEMPTGS